MNTKTLVMCGVVIAGLAACGDAATVGETAFQTNLTALEAQSQVASLIAGTDTGATASFATLTTQGAATYTGPVAINLGDTTLLGTTITGTTELNPPDLLGAASIRTAFTDAGSTLSGDFTDFIGRDGIEYSGSLALNAGRINSSFDGSGGTVGSAEVRGTLSGTGDGDGVYTAGVRAVISESGKDVLVRGSNVDGEPGRDFTFTAAGSVAATE